MKKLLTIIGLLACLTLFGPVAAQSPDEFKKLQDDLKKLVDDNAKLAAQVKADAAAKEKGKEPPVAVENGRGYVPLAPEKLAALHKMSSVKHGDRIASMAMFQALPSSFDCREKIPLPIWNQGSCGSCYLDSTVRTFTCAGIMVGLGKADDSFMFSVQYGMDSPRDFGGCGGGNGTEVADWIVKHGWIAETYVDLLGAIHNDYPPYEARSGRDRTKPGAKVWAKGWDWGFVNNSGKLSANGRHLAAPPNEQIKAALYNYGRINIALAAGGGFGASGTIVSLGDGIDHEINMAGYDDNHDNGDGTKGAWLLENQWGEGWFGVGGGPGCKWCSYKAGKHIVDHFFVSAGPPPPPPPPPPATITVAVGDGTAQVGKSYDIRPVVTGGVGPFTWSFLYGDGATGNLPSHTYATAGGFTVTATAIDSKGSIGTGTARVTVSSGPVPPPIPTPGDYATFDLDKPLAAGRHVVIPKAEHDARKAELDGLLDKMQKLIQEFNGKKAQVPPILEKARSEASVQPTVEPPTIQSVFANFSPYHPQYNPNGKK